MFVHTVVGPMGAGKTKELLARQRSECEGGTVVCVKHAVDVERYGHGLRAHDGGVAWRAQERDFGVAAESLMCPKVIGEVRAAVAQAGKRGSRPAVVLVDEAQFFPDASVFCRFFEKVSNLEVFFAGLESDHARTPFPEMAKLQALSDRVTRLFGECEACGGRSVFTRLRRPPAQHLGAFNEYQPVCRACYVA